MRGWEVGRMYTLLGAVSVELNYLTNFTLFHTIFCQDHPHFSALSTSF
jgi:hypothetical protein